jgi:hypothetical protein
VSAHPFPICTLKYTGQLFEECGAVYKAEKTRLEGTPCSNCERVGSTFVLPPSSTNPAWFFCQNCMLAGDIVDYVLKAKKLAESEIDRILFPDTHCKSVVSDHYLKRRRLRLIAEKFWQNLMSTGNAGRSPCGQAVHNLMCYRQCDWKDKYSNNLAFVGEAAVELLAEMATKPTEVGEFSSHINLKYLDRSIVLRIDSMPGRIEGFLFLREHKGELKSTIRWLPSSSRVGFCFLWTLFHNPNGIKPELRLICTDLISTLHYIREMIGSAFDDPRIAYLTCKSPTKMQALAPSISSLLDLLDGSFNEKAIVFGSTPPFDACLARSLGRRYSSLAIPSRPGCNMHIWHALLRESLATNEDRNSLLFECYNRYPCSLAPYLPLFT